MKVTNYGATLMQLLVPNKKEELINVVVGLPNAKDYASKAYQDYNFYLGATIGRYAGRVANGGFYLENNFYKLEEDITLHGGKHSFDKQIWKVEEIQESGKPYIIFSLESKERPGGFPGDLKVFAKYQILDNTLKISYSATTDAPTIINMTNHSYFNLDGAGSVLGNQLLINADYYLATNKQLVPTGELVAVKDSVFNYKLKTSLLLDGNQGLDTPFKLNPTTPKASLFSENSGIEMQVTTNQNCLVVFTPQEFPNMGLVDNYLFKKYPAICFECQNFPNAPNQNSFPNAVLLPGENYVNEIGYHFTMR